MIDYKIDRLEYPVIISEFDNISEYLILETRKVCEIFDDFINDMTNVVISVKQATLFDVEKAREYANNLWFTGYCYDNVNERVLKSDENKFHPIYIQFHPQVFDGRIGVSPIELKLTKPKEDFNLFYDAGSFMSVRVRDYLTQANDDKIIIDIHLKNYTSRNIFRIKNDLVHECDHIRDMWSIKGFPFISDTIYADIDENYFKEREIDLSKCQNSKTVVKFVKYLLHAFSSTERNTVHKQIDTFCKEHGTEILAYMTTKRYPSRSYLAKHFIDMFENQCVLNIKSKVRYIDWMKELLIRKDVLAVVLEICECVEHGFYTDRSGLFNDYSVARRIISGEDVFNQELAIAIINFIRFYKKNIDVYIEDVKKTVLDALKENDLCKQIMINENLEYNESFSECSYMLTEDITKNKSCYLSTIKELFDSGDISESDMWRNITINVIEQDQMLLLSHGSNSKAESEIYYEMFY